jgi:purine-binding chemotaxis protein CheW
MSATKVVRAQPKLRFLTVWDDGRLFALPAEDVTEVMRMPDVAKIPQGPEEILGLANLRGSVVPLVSLSRLLRSQGFKSPVSRAVILKTTPASGLAVERVNGLVSIERSALQSAQSLDATDSSKRLRGAFKLGKDGETIRVLDLAALFDDRLPPSAKQRAARTARSAAGHLNHAVSEVERPRLITFEVSGQEFAIGLESVCEILNVPATIAVIPKTETLVRGVISYRDRLLSVLSMRGLLGFPEAEMSRAGEKIIVTIIGKVYVGLAVDRTGIVLEADPMQIEPIPTLLAARIRGEAGVTSIYRADGGRRLVSILSPRNLFRADVMERLARSDHDGEHMNAIGQAQEQSSSAPIQFLVFQLGDEEFALPIGCVEEVALVPAQIAKVPKTAAFLEGLVSMRGIVLPIVDQRKRFGLPDLPNKSRRRLVVVKTERYRAGIIVDRVSEVLRTTADAIEETPALAGTAGDLVVGVVNVLSNRRMILVLDPLELLTRTEQGALAEIEVDAHQAPL